jgi:hypothetical protein
MVTGGMAAIIYGEPRLTNDIDVVVQLPWRDAGRFAAVYPVGEFYVPPVESLRAELARPSGGHFNIVDLDSSVRADVYCAGDDPLMAWGMDHRKKVTVGAETVWVAPIEYVILQKLRYYRESGSDRHLRDITAMRRISATIIDTSVIEAWVARLGLEPEWKQAIAFSDH